MDSEALKHGRFLAVMQWLFWLAVIGTLQLIVLCLILWNVWRGAGAVFRP